MLELGEAARSFREVVDEQCGPLRTDDLRARRNGTRCGLVDGIHRAHRYTECSGVNGAVMRPITRGFARWWETVAKATIFCKKGGPNATGHLDCYIDDRREHRRAAHDRREWSPANERARRGLGP